MDRQKSGLSVWLSGGLVVVLLGVVLGCTRSQDEAVAVVSSDFLLTEEPSGAIDVLAARKDAKDQQDVVVVGRIGGRPNLWIEGTAAFPIVDRSLKPCNEIEGDTCATPWDYCCEPELPGATALVMLVDDAGETLKQDPREMLPVKELQTVVVQGKAKRDDADNLTILASKVYVQPDVKAKE
jgi:hypothetical protein